MRCLVIVEMDADSPTEAVQELVDLFEEEGDVSWNVEVITAEPVLHLVHPEDK